MRVTAIIFCVLVAGVLPSASARTWYILPDSTGDAPTIRQALNLANSGDDVLVSQGTYYEHTLVMKDGVWLHSEWGPDVTTVDAQGQGDVISCTNVSSASTIEGFTLTGAYGSAIECDESSPMILDNIICNNSGPRGSAIYIDDDSSPTVVANTISDNSASDLGGAIYLDTSCSPLIEGNSIIGNSAVTGGAIYACCGSPSAPEIIGNTISGNNATTGGGIYCTCAATIRGNDITGNTATGNGGGMLIRYVLATVDSNTVSGNSADLGGGIYCESVNELLEIRDNILSGNNASKGAGLYCEDCNPGIVSNLFTLNEATNWGGGIYCYSDSARIEWNVIVGNTSGIYGGGVGLYSSYTGLVGSNTIIENSAPHGGGLSCQFGADAVVSNNIIAGSLDGEGIYCHSANPTLSCNDIWGNVGGDAVCGTDGGGNFSDDPYFCDPDNGDYFIDEGSPCAPANSPLDCGLIGALPPGCAYAGIEPGTTQSTTWGGIKSMYR